MKEATIMNILSRVDSIRQELLDASKERWGRAPEIIAVSKTVEPERGNEVRAAGILRLGENRVQEIMAKLPYLDASFQIDLIGRLQNNKVKYIIDKVGMIQALDRMGLAQEIDRRAQQRGIRMPALIQVNIGSEPQKGGIEAEDLFSFARAVAALDGIEIRGLMAVMPDLEDEEELRPYFRRMRSLFDALREEAIAGTRIDELSMGMSGDYLLAAQEGATHVRIGSAIFGSRCAPAMDMHNEEDKLEGDLHS